MKKILIIGANGQLGSDLVLAYRANGDWVVGATHTDFDLRDTESMTQFITKVNPDCIINTAAMANVETCELHPNDANLINALAPAYLAHYCDLHYIQFVHFSTDYVFGGDKTSPYTEDDIAAPLNIYGNTKLIGELSVLNENQHSTVIRVAGLYGTSPCRAKNGLNFVSSMIKLANEREFIRVVNDEIVSPTFTENIAAQCIRITDSNVYGIVHCVSQGQCSWYEFAEEILTCIGQQHKLQIAAASEFPAKVARPKYSALKNTVLQQFNIDIMPHWKVGLRQYMTKIGY